MLGFGSRPGEPQTPPLRSPGFPVEFDGGGALHAPFPQPKGAYAALSSAARLEIRIKRHFHDKPAERRSLGCPGNVFQLQSRSDGFFQEKWRPRIPLMIQ